MEQNVNGIYFDRSRQSPDIYYYRLMEQNVNGIYFDRSRQSPDIYYYH